MLKWRVVRVWTLVGAIVCGVLVASCNEYYYSESTGELVKIGYSFYGSYVIRRQKMTRAEYDKYVSDDSSAHFEEKTEANSAGVSSAATTTTAELVLLFEDEEGQQTSEYYELRGSFRSVGDYIISVDMTEVSTAQGAPVTATFSLTPTVMDGDVALAAEGTLNLNLPDGTYTGPLGVDRIVDR